MATPDSADVIEMFFGDDDKLVQTFELQCLDKAFDMSPQVRCHRNRPFDLNPAGVENLIKLAAELRVVVPHEVFRSEAHVFGNDQEIASLLADPC